MKPSLSRRPSGLLLSLCCSILLLAVCGCAEAPTPHAPSQEAAPPTRLQELLPLENDTVSQFETTSDGGPPGMFVLEIGRPRADLAELKIAGRVQRLLVDSKRIRHAVGGTLLEEPLTEGHHFRGSFGQVTIVDVDHTIEVPAGKFSHCLVTIEESTHPKKRATSTFCPGVGLVSLTVEAFGGGGELLKNRLMMHGPRFK